MRRALQLTRTLSTRSALSILSDPTITRVLATHKLTADTPIIDTPCVIEVLSAFRSVCNRPLPSDAYLRVKTVADIADYYEGALAHKGVFQHTRNVHDKVVPNPLPRVDASPEAVGEHVKSSLPSNLQLDPKMFAERPVAVMSTGARPLNVPKFNRRLRMEERRTKRLEQTARRRAEREARRYK